MSSELVPVHFVAYEPEAELTINDDGPPTVENHDELVNNGQTYGEIRAMEREQAENYDLDIRGVRLPGILSYKTLPGGGTTDYAVEVFYDAIEQGHYEYFVRPNTMLPMMYMPDAVNALMQLAEADDEGLNYRCAYNVSALTFTAEELTDAIREHLPDFEATYEPDDRQAIADSWPDRVDDTAAREDWDWEPEYKLEDMVEDMLTNLEKKLSE